MANERLLQAEEEMLEEAERELGIEEEEWEDTTDEDLYEWENSQAGIYTGTPHFHWN